MSYLIGKLFFCLFVTLLVGLLLGWLVSRYLIRSRTDYYRNKLQAIENDHHNLAERLRDEKLEHEVCDQKYSVIQAQWYEMKRELENERLSSTRYKERLSAERKSGVDQRFKLERNLTQRDIRIEDLDLDLHNTRLQASRDLNHLNGRLRHLMDEEEQGERSEVRLRQERDELREELEVSELELSKIRHKLQNLEQTDSESTLELRQTAQMYQQLQDTHSSLSTKHERLTDRYAGLEDKFDSITQERDSLRTQMIDVGDKEDALELGMRSVSDERVRLQGQLVSARQEGEQCRNRYQKVQDELKEQKTQCRSMIEHFAGMDKELAHFRMECAQLKERLDTLK